MNPVLVQQSVKELCEQLHKTGEELIHVWWWEWLVMGEIWAIRLIFLLYSYMVNSCWIITTQYIITSEDFFKKNIPLNLFARFERVVSERELETEHNCNIYWPPLLWPSALWLSRSPDAQPETRGTSSLLSAGLLYHIFSNCLTSCLDRVI